MIDLTNSAHLILVVLILAGVSLHAAKAGGKDAPDGFVATWVISLFMYAVAFVTLFVCLILNAA